MLTSHERNYQEWTLEDFEEHYAELAEDDYYAWLKTKPKECSCSIEELETFGETCDWCKGYPVEGDLFSQDEDISEEEPEGDLFPQDEDISEEELLKKRIKELNEYMLWVREEVPDWVREGEPDYEEGEFE